MKSLYRSDAFNADVHSGWLYLHSFGEALANRFIDRIEESLRLLARHPGVGRPGRYRHPRLVGLRVWAVARPFSDWLIFHWDRPARIELYRLLHGARELPRRLAEG